MGARSDYLGRVVFDEETAPSGLKVTFRKMPAAAVAKVVGAMPFLKIAKSNGDGEGAPVDPEAQLTALMDYYRVFIPAGVASPRITSDDDGDEESIPFDLLEREDVYWMAGRIQELAGLKGARAEEADTFPVERVERGDFVGSGD